MKQKQELPSLMHPMEVRQSTEPLTKKLIYLLNATRPRFAFDNKRKNPLPRGKSLRRKPLGEELVMTLTNFLLLLSMPTTGLAKKGLAKNKEMAILVSEKKADDKETEDKRSQLQDGHNDGDEDFSNRNNNDGDEDFSNGNNNDGDGSDSSDGSEDNDKQQDGQDDRQAWADLLNLPDASPYVAPYVPPLHDGGQVIVVASSPLIYGLLRQEGRYDFYNNGSAGDGLFHIGISNGAIEREATTIDRQVQNIINNIDVDDRTGDASPAGDNNPSGALPVEDNNPLPVNPQGEKIDLSAGYIIIDESDATVTNIKLYDVVQWAELEGWIEAGDYQITINQGAALFIKNRYRIEDFIARLEGGLTIDDASIGFVALADRLREKLLPSAFETLQDANLDDRVIEQKGDLFYFTDIEYGIAGNLVADALLPTAWHYAKDDMI